MTTNTLRKVHLALAVLWALMVVPTILFWKNSVLFVGLVSVYALVITHLSAAAGYTPVDDDD